MGYFKRKRTKRRGKKGTKKYRGGSANAEVMTTGSNAVANPAVMTTELNAEKDVVKAEVKKQIESLKSALDQVDLDAADLGKLNTMRDAMTTFMTALST